MYVCVLEGGYKSKFWKFLCTYEVDDAQKLNELIIIENLSCSKSTLCKQNLKFSCVNLGVYSASVT